MLMLSWLLLVTPLQTEQLYNVFMSAFLAQNRTNAEELSDYFYKKIMPRFETGHLLDIAIDDGRIVGFALFEKWEPQTYYLAEMAILPSYQRQGLGRKLIFSLFDKDPATQKILLMTERRNTLAQSFYENIGFKHSSFLHPDYPPADFTGYEYSK